MNGSLLVAFNLLKSQEIAGHVFNRLTFRPIEYGQFAPCVSVLFVDYSRFVSGGFAFAMCPRSLIRPDLSGALSLRIRSSISYFDSQFSNVPIPGTRTIRQVLQTLVVKYLLALAGRVWL
ncbi:TPA: hypothetical protein IEP67_000270 [Escherichia coli]|nr:hypothetical protein [Escherichia coli]